MAYTQINVQRPGMSGSALTYTDADVVNDGNKFSNDGTVYLAIYNNGATGTATVTLATGKTVHGHAVSDQAISVTTSQIKIAGPFNQDLFNQKSGDDVGCIRAVITGTGAADVDLAVFK